MEKLRQEVDAIRIRVDELEKLMKSFDLKLRTMEAISGRPGKEGEGEGFDPSQLVKLMESLKLELLATLVTQDNFNALARRVEVLEILTKTINEEQDKLKIKVNGVEGQTNINTDDINAIKERLKLLEQKLGNKVNCEDFDKLMILINQFKTTYCSA